MSFVRGSQYSCTSTICYGIGDAAHRSIIALQNVINSALKASGFSTKITADGKIGSGTVSALKNLATRIRGPILSGLSVTPMDPKEYVAKFTPELAVEIPGAVAATGADAVSSFDVPRVTGAASSVSIPNVMLPPLKSPGAATTAFDSVSKLIRQATAASHGAAPSATPITPPLPGATSAPIITKTFPSSGMSTTTKVAMGVGGVAVLGLAYHLLTKKE